MLYRMLPYLAVSALILAVAAYAHLTYPGPRYVVADDAFCRANPEMIHTYLCSSLITDLRVYSLGVACLAGFVLFVGLIGDFWGQLRLYGLVSLMAVAVYLSAQAPQFVVPLAGVVIVVHALLIGMLLWDRPIRGPAWLR